MRNWFSDRDNPADGLNLDFMLPGGYEFVVLAVSQGDGRIRNEDAAAVMLTGYEAVAVAWRPETQTVTNTLTAIFLLVISNTGNLTPEPPIRCLPLMCK